MKQFKKLTSARVIAAVKKDNGTGFCLKCGHSRKQVEPDAENYPCNNCKENRVTGAENCLLRL